MRYLSVKMKRLSSQLFFCELYRLQLKYLAYNVSLPYWLREFAFIALWNQSISGARSLWRAQCLFSYSTRSIISFFRVSRMYLKYLLSVGLLSGIRKSSW